MPNGFSQRKRCSYPFIQTSSTDLHCLPPQVQALTLALKALPPGASGLTSSASFWHLSWVNSMLSKSRSLAISQTWTFCSIYPPPSPMPDMLPSLCVRASPTLHSGPFKCHFLQEGVPLITNPMLSFVPYEVTEHRGLALS